MMEAQEANQLLQKLENCLEEVIPPLWEGQAWIALGYKTWDDLCRDRIHGTITKLSREDRREKVMALRGDGMSGPAISSALNIGETTVRRDIARSPKSEPQAKVKGVDGKSYPATKPKIDHSTPETKRMISEITQAQIDTRGDRLLVELRTLISRLNVYAQDHPDEFEIRRDQFREALNNCQTTIEKIVIPDTIEGLE